MIIPPAIINKFQGVNQYHRRQQTPPPQQNFPPSTHQHFDHNAIVIKPPSNAHLILIIEELEGGKNCRSAICLCGMRNYTPPSIRSLHQPDHNHLYSPLRGRSEGSPPY